MRFTPPNDGAWRKVHDPKKFVPIDERPTTADLMVAVPVILVGITLLGAIGWKLAKLIFPAIFALVLCLAFTGCTTTTVTAPDGTVTTTRGPAPGSLELAGKALQVVADK